MRHLTIFWSQKFSKRILNYFQKNTSESEINETSDYTQGIPICLKVGIGAKPLDHDLGNVLYIPPCLSPIIQRDCIMEWVGAAKVPNIRCRYIKSMI